VFLRRVCRCVFSPWFGSQLGGGIGRSSKCSELSSVILLYKPCRDICLLRGVCQLLYPLQGTVLHSQICTVWPHFSVSSYKRYMYIWMPLRCRMGMGEINEQKLLKIKVSPH
jgi:hypothetical protein